MDAAVISRRSAPPKGPKATQVSTRIRAFVISHAVAHRASDHRKV
jgi:hypothetical protein